MKHAWVASLLAVPRLATAKEFAPLHDYLSRPDLKVPRLSIDSFNASSVAPGYVFMSPFYPELHPGTPIAANEENTVNFHAAPMIYDNQGHLVWSGFNRTGEDLPPLRVFGTMGFEVCDFGGQPHLCFAHYHPNAPIHHDIVNEHYETVHSIWSKGDSHGLPLMNDTHEFNIKWARSTGEQTAIITSSVVRKLSQPVHHLKCDLNISWVQSSVFQEMSLSTDEVMFQWDSFDHIPLQDSHCPGNDGFWRAGDTPHTSWDHFHMNSVDKDEEGNYYVSGRHTSTLYKISGQNGSVMWSVGELGTFQMISEVEGMPPDFGFQHHLRLHEDYSGYDIANGRAVVSLYDNGNDHYDFSTKTANFSSGKVFLIDERQRIAILKEAYPLLRDPHHQLSTNQGSFQLLPNGNRIIGGGSIQEVIEWQPGNPEPVFIAHWGDWEYPDGTVGHKINSYRSLRFEWKGVPLDSPAIFAFAPECGALVTSYMSWNGATEVAAWEIWGGATQTGAFQHMGSTNHTGFESRVSSGFTNYVFAVALDLEMNELGRSAPQRVAVPNASNRRDLEGMQCSEDRCEPGFDYVAFASRECPTAIAKPPVNDGSRPGKNILDQQEEEGVRVTWMHCDPCFGLLNQLWRGLASNGGAKASATLQ